MTKTYMGFSIDCSASMRSLREAARRDHNDNLQTIRQACLTEQQDVVVSLVKCGERQPSGYTKNTIGAINSSIHALAPLASQDYECNGSNTPLFDSVAMLIEMLKKAPDADDEQVSFLVQATTDGEDNASKLSGRELGQLIQRLQATDRWTFVFRVPQGYAKRLVSLGIPAGNILEWSQTEQGIQQASQANSVAVVRYLQGRAQGARSTATFYSDLSDVSSRQVRETLENITGQVQLWPVGPQDEGMQIKDFFEREAGQSYEKGKVFYELMKLEKKIQAYKKVCIRNRSSGKVYTGDEARRLLGLPEGQDARVNPADHANYQVFIQSTSLNRKLVAGTEVLYWPRA